MITFETQEDFENAVMEIIREKLSLEIESEYVYGGIAKRLNLILDGAPVTSYGVTIEGGDNGQV